MKFKLPHESLDVSEFDFALLESMTQKKHRLAFECYAEISEEMFSGVPILKGMLSTHRFSIIFRRAQSRKLTAGAKTIW